jgi:hypothetical protein
MSGRLTIAPRAGTGIRAKRRTLILGHLLATKLAGGRQTTLTIRLKARTRRQVAAALAKKRRVTLVLHGVASARGMTPGTARITVRLLR